MVRISSSKPLTSTFLKSMIFILALGSLVAAGSSIYVFVSTRQIQELARERLNVTDHSLRVLWYDEVLTMSALLAASTNKAEWEVRYREFEPRLDRSINYLAKKSEPQAQLASEINKINLALVDIELQSFKLNRENKSRDAFQLLTSDNYNRLKTQYSELLNEYVNESERINTVAWHDHLILVERLILFLFALITISGMGWIFVLQASTRWNQKFRFLTERTLSIQEDERSRLAREIHDDLGQQLSALKIWLSKLDDTPPESGPDAMKEALDILASSQDSVRRLSQSLHPSLLQNIGLKAALDWLLKPISSGLDMDISIKDETDGAFEKLPESHRSQLYRIAQEAINNIQKHAQASKIWIDLEKTPQGLKFSICDNGIGFQKSQSGIGLFSMKERTQMLGGQIEISSPISHRSRLRLQLPDNEPGTELSIQFPDPSSNISIASFHGLSDGPAQ